MSGFGQAAPDADVQLAASFRLEIDGIQCMAFEKFDPGVNKRSTYKNRTGIDGLTPHEHAGLDDVIEAVIEKNERVGGVDDINEWLDWYAGRSSDKRNGAVIYLDANDNAFRRRNFSGAWIKEYEGPKSDANSEDGKMTHIFKLSIHTLELYS